MSKTGKQTIYNHTDQKMLQLGTIHKPGKLVVSKQINNKSQRNISQASFSGE